MRGITWLLFLGCLGFFNVARAQRLNYVKKGASVLDVFEAIKRQTGFSVVWNEQKLDVSMRLDANFHSSDISQVMKTVLSGQQMEYTIVNSTIILKAKPAIQTIQPMLIRDIPLKEVEILSTGYQQLPRERAAGSFTKVDSARFNYRVSTDIISRLQGITSGLLFNSNTGKNQNLGADLSIRGRSTIFANDQPLIVLDNFPYNGTLASLNPNDVAGISVLKDAAAASIWGVRAGNGVIVISTKKGALFQPLSIELNTNLSYGAKPDLSYNSNFLNAADFIDFETYLFDKGTFDQALADQTSYPVLSPVVKLLAQQRNGGNSAQIRQRISELKTLDVRSQELKYFYRNPISQQYALSLKGGSSSAAHYLSLGYDQGQGTLRQNSSGRLTLNTSNNLQLSKSLGLDLGMNFIRSSSRQDSTLKEIIETNAFFPYFEFLNPDGSPAVFERGINSEYTSVAKQKGLLDWDYRPLEELGKSPTRFFTSDLRLWTALRYQLMRGLTASVNYQYQHASTDGQRFTAVQGYRARNLINRFTQLNSLAGNAYPLPFGGIDEQNNHHFIAHDLRLQAAYQTSLGKHQWSALAGYEISSLQTDLTTRTAYGYDPALKTETPVDYDKNYAVNPIGIQKIPGARQHYGTLDRIRSLYANLGYVYNGKYVLSASARIDGANYFGVKTNHKYQPLWSVGTLWHLDRENFYPDWFLSEFKLRASFGYNGNVDKRAGGLTTFKYSLSPAPFTGLSSAGLLSVGNPQLGWEKMAITNLGIDFGVSKGWLSGTLEYYDKNGSRLIGDQAFAANTGISVLRGNYAALSVKGIDLNLVFRPVIRRWNWTTSLLVSRATERVVSYGLTEQNSIYYVGNQNAIPVQEKPVFGVYSYPWAGLDPSSGDPLGYLNGTVSKDYAAILATAASSALTYHGPARPTVFGGLSNTVSYRRLSLNVNVSYKLGYYFWKPSVNYYLMESGSLPLYAHKDYSARWQRPGDELRTSVPSIGQDTEEAYRDDFYGFSSVNVAKGDHVRWSDISLNYTINPQKIRLGPMKKIELYAYASNLGILWKANDFDIDPDVIAGQGDRLATRPVRTVSLGLKANF